MLTRAQFAAAVEAMRRHEDATILEETVALREPSRYATATWTATDATITDVAARAVALAVEIDGWLEVRPGYGCVRREVKVAVWRKATVAEVLASMGLREDPDRVAERAGV